MSPKNNDVFVRITNKEVYSELTAFREENERQHEAIKTLIAQYKADNEKKFEEINGSINLVKATVGGAVALVVAIGGWLIYHLMSN